MKLLKFIVKSFIGSGLQVVEQLNKKRKFASEIGIIKIDLKMDVGISRQLY